MDADIVSGLNQNVNMDEVVKNFIEEQQENIKKLTADLSAQKDSSADEIEAIKRSLKEITDYLKSFEKPQNKRILTGEELYYSMGKGIYSLYHKDAESLGRLKFCPNLKTDKWNNPTDFTWIAGKGFVANKGVLGEPAGNLSGNDQYLLAPAIEAGIIEEAAGKSVMMNLVSHRPMNTSSIYMHERKRGGLKLKWLTQYGQKIDPLQAVLPGRVELKSATLAGYIPYFDEFGEDAFIDLGKLFVEDLTDAYAQEFDVQCLTAKDSPFTGALHAGKNVHAVADIGKLSYLDLREAEQKIPAEERRNCKWFFSETVTTHLMNVTDENGYPIWRKPGDDKSARIDGYEYYEVSCLPQFADIKADTPFAVFMDPRKIIHGNRKGIEIRKFDQTSESLEYGEEFFRFRKRDAFLCTLADSSSVILKTK